MNNTPAKATPVKAAPVIPPTAEQQRRLEEEKLKQLQVLAE